ncbi:MAG: hypothetical protein ACF8MJ_08370 [Phycisphaerales bacterium JB050]
MTNPGLPMMGSASFVVRGVKKADIHGDVYYDTALSPRDDPVADPVALRLPNHLLMDPPRAGDELEITFLMGQPSVVKRL